MSTARGRRAILFTALAACVAGAAALSAQSPDPKTLGYPAAGEPPIVKLLTAGAEPRTALRYSVAKDYKMHAESSSETTTSVTMEGNAMPGMDLPSTKLGSDIVVTDVSVAGDVTYTVSYTGLTLSGGNPMLAQMMQGAEADYKSISGVVTTNNRGFNKAAKFDYSKLSNPAMAQALGGMTSAMENMCLPLPEEAIGVGGRWEVRQSINAAGILQYQKTEYEVTSIKGKTVVLKVTQEGMALAQQVMTQTVPGAETALKSMSLKGTGTVTVQLDGLVPTLSLSSTTSMAMELKMAGNTMNMATDATTKNTVTPVGPPK